MDVKYYRFIYRFLVGTGAWLTLLLIFILELMAVSKKTNLEMFWIFNTMGIILLLSLINNILRARKYIALVEINDNVISLIIADFDKQLDKLEIPIADLKIDIKDNFLDKYRRFRLEIRVKNKFHINKYDLIIKQYEIGFWKMEKQKELYKIIKNKKGEFEGTASIGRSIYGEKKERTKA